MDLKYGLKQLAERIPYPAGRWLAHVPHRFRLGSAYASFSRAASRYTRASPAERQAYAIFHLDRIVRYAQNNIPFYRKLYGPTTRSIRSLEDFRKLPVIAKPQVREYAKQSSGARLINTGGSSGEPLGFYIDRGAWAREWAHMHQIWGLRGYHPTHLMITILGRNLGADLYRYNAVHNEFRLNPYLSARERVPDIVGLIRHYPVRYIQGYPSSIYNLLREMEPGISADDKALVSSRIRCCFLSSEYPLPYMVAYLRDVWNLDHISWYGHSEMCVLAYDEHRDGCYTPFVTYGFAEDVDNVLCGTSYHNLDMPLIRYSTGDRIESKIDGCGLLERFAIREGREGDFIEDRHGKMLPLTALIFGRHHRIFNVADYVQISQEMPGSAVLHITAEESAGMSRSNVAGYFDWSDVEVDFDYSFRRSPVRTRGGKLKLKLSANDCLETRP